jgi:4-aminobutyrate aminotransferase-like enzyme/Ser/Thr protein kinase RdoA (MazF antagonist)/CHAD domain-containing protein
MHTTEPADRLTLAEPLGEGILRIMITQLDLALLSLEGLNPDVHAARKAMKRVRGLLRMVRGPLGTPTYRTVNDALRDAARVLAPARDAAATIETFADVISRHPRVLDAAAVADISATLEQNDFTHRARLAADPAVVQDVSAALLSSRARLTEVKLTASPGPADGDFSLIERGLRRTYKRCRTGFATASADPTEEAFHRWRKDVKYLRYQLEALVAYAPESLGDRASDLDTLGELLGSSQDLVVLRHTLHDVMQSSANHAEATGLSSLSALMRTDLDALNRSAAEMAEAVFDPRPRAFVESVRVAFTKPEHVEIARAAYGIVGRGRPLPGEVDDLARIDTPDGTSYVLRISPPSTAAATHDLVEATTRAANEYGIRAPLPISTIDGADRLQLADGRIARVQTWISGDQMASLPMSHDLAVSIGTAAGDIVNALARLPEPAAKPAVHHWELSSSTTTITGLFEHLAGDRHRALIQQALDRIEQIPFEDLPHQVIHNDLNLENLLLTSEGTLGVIDFGDTAWSVRIGELAISCAYAMIGQDDPIGVSSAIAAAYASRTTVTPAEARWLFDLIVARLAVSMCIAASRPGENPHHQTTADGVRDLLGTLLAADAEWIIDRLASACLDEPAPLRPATTERLVRAREVLGSSLRLSYREPLHITRGSGQYLYDARARRFLDGVNNVAHVGHANPTVAEASSRQASVLNTNTRYLHEEALRYASRLVDTLPKELDTVFLVNSGSEANELALRIARSATGRSDLVCLDHGYHGNTRTLVDISPYKFNGPGGTGRKEGVIVLPSPDPYRNPLFDGEDAGETYRLAADEAIGASEPAALIAEALPGCGGQVVPAPGVVAAAYEAVRRAGGIVIADEVQTGLGRVGTRFWAFELHDVIPDVVTIGKPAGNGHPLAAVVTTSALATAFDTGMEYFNTFGGNPVSAAIGNAVLDVIERDRLQARARIAGEQLISGLNRLAESHHEIGDVRGKGLFIGIEIVTDRRTREPHPDMAGSVVETARSNGVLLSTDGPHHNVIKIKPPLVITDDDCERFIATIGAALP